SSGKKLFARLAQEMLDVHNPGAYNQAIMDFGALQCKPKKPLCEECVFRLDCRALQENNVEVLPVKLKGKGSRNRYFHYFIVREADRALMAKRGQGDVWTSLYEFLLIDTVEDMYVIHLMIYTNFTEYVEENKILKIVDKLVNQALSHQNIYARLYIVSEAGMVKAKKNEWDYHYYEKIDKLAKHKLIY